MRIHIPFSLPRARELGHKAQATTVVLWKRFAMVSSVPRVGQISPPE
jgi:ribosomal protein L15E